MIKNVILVAAAMIATGTVLFAIILRIENRETYWQWRIESNVDTIFVSIFVLFIVWLIVRDIRNKLDN